VGGQTLEADARERYRAGDYDASIALHARAFAAYRRTGDALGGARAGRALAWLHGNVHGDWAVAAGWRERAIRLLEEVGGDADAAVGWALLLRTYGDLALDPDAQAAAYRSAASRGRAAGDVDLEVDGLVGAGLVDVLAGRADDGMRALDEALAAVCAGEVADLYVVEGAFCVLFQCCEQLHDVARAEQWVRAATSTIGRHGSLAAAAFCRAHYGGILTDAGRWSEAEHELLASADVFAAGYAAMAGVAQARLAGLRVRQGRFEDAAELLADLGDLPDAVRPLAELRIARGELALARDGLARALPVDTPVTAASAPVLALLVEVLVELDDLPAAAAAADRIAGVAARSGPTSPATAFGALAAGRVAAADGSADPRPALEAAVRGFGAARLPLEQARARIVLAEAVAATDPAAARAECTRALRACETHGAARDADRADALLRSLGTRARVRPKGDGLSLTRREDEVLSLLGRGLSNVEIAERLLISRKTVEHHVGHVLAKLGVRNRAEAAVVASHRPDTRPPA
jgi:DNA-binding CsgD family transcriptional regulator